MWNGEAKAEIDFIYFSPENYEHKENSSAQGLTWLPDTDLGVLYRLSKLFLFSASLQELEFCIPAGSQAFPTTSLSLIQDNSSYLREIKIISS